MGEVDLYTKTRNAMKRYLPQRYVSFKHNDMKTGGIPDMSLVGNQFTSWWEFKYNDEDGFDWEGIQHLTACRLNRESYCRYVIYDKHTRCIFIVEPLKLGGFVATIGTSRPEHFEVAIDNKGPNYDHYALVMFMRGVHKL